MKCKLNCLIGALLAMTGIVDCHALSGKWRGDLNLGHAKLPLVFNFQETPSGETEATMDSPQQNAKDIPLNVLFCSNDSISLECKMIGATFNAKVSKGMIDGVFSQMGHKLALTLTPETSLSERRPQTPQPPFPYVEKDTVFISTDGTELAGTISIPTQASGQDCPIVVMVTGSGPQNRDEEIFEHRPFAVIADYFAKNGIATFRYDDRGVGSSKGDYAKATIETFKQDTKSAINFAKSLPEFNKVGILGHSEGGTLALVTASDAHPAFIISLAGMVIPSKETLLAQNIHSLDRNGITGNQKEASIKLVEILFDTIISQYKEGIVQPIDIDLVCKENSLDVPAFIVESVKQSNKSRNGYFDSLVSLDPTEDLRKVSCPVLAINGTKDMQVDADLNLSAFSRNVRNVEIKSMEGLNHLMQHATTGDVGEYGDIRETFSPEVLEIMVDFIKRQ